MKKRTNYDEIASTYNQRYTGNAYPGTLKALRRILSEERHHKVLEVGCGTSHWLKALRTIREISYFGIDSSFNMLKKSQHPDGIHLTQGMAENLPFSDNLFDFIFVVNAVHHFSKKIAFLKEAYRVLTENGKLSIIGMDPADSRNKWYVYQFFEGTFDRDITRFPTQTQLEKWLLRTGFKILGIEDVEMIHDPKIGRNVLQDAFLKKNACSQLAMLSDKEYKDGLIKINDKLNTTDGENFKFENDIVLKMITAEK
ncbi:MAG: methyltransferase domain-containing protein [Brevefilum sp.]|nr:methyltransferase domain-containing protein [Brevefilum sp.]